MKTVVLRIDEAVAGAYPVTLTGVDIDLNVQYVPPAGAAMAGGLTPADIRNQLAQQPVPDLQAIARQLGSWACPAPVSAAVVQCVQQGESIRVALDVQASDVKDLPWELMRSAHLPDFLDSTLPFVRQHAGRKTAPPVEWPLRVLVVVGAAVDSDIRAEEEVFAIERTLHGKGHSIDREVLRRPDGDTLFRKLQEFRPHVFVFIGHCEVDPVSQRAVLRFQDGANSWDWGPDKVALDMANARWTPSLVLLNACRTHDAGASFTFSDAFIRGGVPACITMQGDVRGDLAGRFSAEVLQSLFDDHPLDVAVALARHAIAGPAPMDVLDWAYPVLSMADPSQTLFPPRPKYPLHDNNRTFDDVQFFADRRDLRRVIRGQLRNGTAASEPATAPVNLAVIAGDQRCGKTHLAKWCLQNFALVSNAAVRYVPIAGSRMVDFVTLLRRMRDGFGGATSPDASAFHAFHWTLNRILSGQVPAAWNGQPTADEGLAFDATVVTYEHAVRDIFAAYLDALQQLSSQRRVVIVLDQFRDHDRVPAMEPRLFQDVLVPHLLLPLQQGKAPGVLMILVMEAADCRTFGIDALVPPSEWITVNPDVAEPIDALMRELFWYPDAETLGTIEDVVSLTLERLKARGKDRSAAAMSTLCRAVASVMYDNDDVAMRTELGVQQMG